MTARLSPRGPDGSGVVETSGVVMGHRRLSILDLSVLGAQPMTLESEGLIISYNGEIYNYRTLRSQLEALNHRFVGHSDTEVILHAYQAWGLSGLKRLEGIFAFALWDAPRRRLVLIRDRLGVKPIYYAESQHGLAFASEIKAILAAGGVNTELDDQAFSEYLWYGNPYADRSFYKGVRALEPGHWLIIENGSRTLQPWWSIEEWIEDDTITLNDFNEGVHLVRESLDMAVARQLVADVPVGLFLSGGLDSSAIAASAMESQLRPLQSFSVGFDFDGGVNELPKAALVAQHLGLDHHELMIRGSEIGDLLLTLARAHDEPFADAANLPLYLMCQQLQGNIKVVLQGDGGDELFGGYRRYTMLRNTRLWALWPQILSPFLRVLGSYGKRFARMADSVGCSEASLRMAYLLTTETSSSPPTSLFYPDRQQQLLETTDPFLAYRRSASRFDAYDPVEQMLLTDLTVQLPSQFLTKVDRATMASGIESRVPLLDEMVARLAVKLPSTWKVTGRHKKYILRESQRDRLPISILDGPKTGFGVPYQEWLRSSLFEFTRDHLLDDSFLSSFSLQRNLVEQILLMHQQRIRNSGFTLWKLLQLSIWHSMRDYARP